MRHARLKTVSVLRGPRPAAPATPQLVRDTATSLWNITWDGPLPENWQEWKRCDYLADWTVQGTLAPVDFPANTDAILEGDEQWWQVKFVGVDGDGNRVTPFSNVVS